MSTSYLDEEFDDVSGDAILSGAREARVYVPALWSAEYAGFRLTEAFEILRLAQVGRIGPRGADGFWPEVIRDEEDFRHWPALEKKREKEQRPPTGADLARMEEALAWPMRFLADQPLFADAVTIGAFTQAWEIDPANFLKHRRRAAKPVAQRLAQQRNVELRDRARVEKEAIKAWCVQEFAAKKVAGMSIVKRAAAVDAINERATKRWERWVKHNPPIKANATLALPNKILEPRTLDRVRWQALGMLADRMHAASVPVR